MSKKVLVQQIQPMQNGPVYGQVSDPRDFQKSQDYAHTHIELITRDCLMQGATGALVSGFDFSLNGGLGISVGPGHVIDRDGYSYETDADPTALTLPAAHPSLPRIDLIVAVLERDVPSKLELRPFVRLRTQQEIESGVPPYAPEQFNQPTELHTRATVAVRQGIADANPTPPIAGANEVPLYTVRVAAGQMTLNNNDVTDVRQRIRSLHDAWGQIQSIANSPAIANLNEAIDDRVAATVQAGDGLTKAYDDANNTLTISGVPASASQNGLMTAADKQKLDAATNAATPNALMRRDANGDASVRQLQSTASQGTAPLSVQSSTLVSNLNADMVDGQHLADLDSRFVNANGDTVSGQLNVIKGSATNPISEVAIVGTNWSTASNQVVAGVVGVADRNQPADHSNVEAIGVYGIGRDNNAGGQFTTGVRGIGYAGPNYDARAYGGRFEGTNVPNNLAGLKTLIGVEGRATLIAQSNSPGVLYGGYFVAEKQNTQDATAYGVYATASGTTSWAGYFVGNVNVTGTLSKGSGTFLIDHPLDPLNRNLYHGFVEAPEYLLVYRGRVQLENGTATVSIDEACGMSHGTFTALTADADVVCLTNRTGFARIRASEVINGQFTIECEDPDSDDTVTWVVMARRNDPFIKCIENTDADGRLILEFDKPEPKTEELAQLATNEDETGEVMSELIGKRGFPLHGRECGGPVPRRRRISNEEQGNGE